MRFRSLLISAFAAVALPMAAGASAGTVSFSTSFWSPTDVTAVPVSLPRFDPGLGTLISAAFSLNARMETLFSVVHDGNVRVGWDKLQYDLTLAGAGSYGSATIGAGAGPIRLVGSGVPDGTFSFAEHLNVITGISPSTFIHSGPVLSAAQTFTFGALPAFVGAGVVDFFLTTVNLDAFFAFGQQTGGLPSPAPADVSTLVFADLGVTYTYSEIPLPASLWLLLGGLLGFGAFTRRRATP